MAILFLFFFAGNFFFHFIFLCVVFYVWTGKFFTHCQNPRKCIQLLACYCCCLYCTYIWMCEHSWNLYIFVFRKFETLLLLVNGRIEYIFSDSFFFSFALLPSSFFQWKSISFDFFSPLLLRKIYFSIHNFAEEYSTSR